MAEEKCFKIGMSGLTLLSKDKPRWLQPAALQVQVLRANGEIAWAHSRYNQFSEHHNIVEAEGIVKTPSGAKIHFEDCWTSLKTGLSLTRKVKVLEVKENDEKGFLSAFELETIKQTNLGDLEIFAPSKFYGTSHKDYFRIDSKSHLQPPDIGYIKENMLREDRLPAPIFTVRSHDNSTLSIVHCDPKGDTVSADFYDRVDPLVDQNIRFGSLGIRELNNHVRLCFWFPGTQGAVTNIKRATKASTPLSYTIIPHTNTWQRVYHPLKTGLMHKYELYIAVNSSPNVPMMIRTSWRCAFDILKPKIIYHDLEIVERVIIKQLSELVQILPNGVAGIPQWLSPVTGEVLINRFGLGFAARNECAAYHLLRSGHKEKNDRYLEQGRAILNFWTKRTGPGLTPSGYFPDHERFGGGYDYLGDQGKDFGGIEAVSLREMSEGHQGCLWSWNLERRFGVEHPQWIEWCKGFGDWLLTQQQPSGGFPRWWSIETGEVVDPALNSSYNPIAFLCELATATKEKRFLHSALRAAEYLYKDHQHKGIFIGGTIEFGHKIIDKEAASISMEAYLALYKATNDKQWLEAAQLAADIAETYTYIWEVPMPADIDSSALHWKPGATTIGVQSIGVPSFGAKGAAVDQYLAWNVDEYAQLYELTKDEHYWHIAMILLHNTKSMLALPGRTFDLKGPGWQQEHWHMASSRGFGWGWTTKGDLVFRPSFPWVTLSHLTGLTKLQDRSPTLWKKAFFIKP